MYTVRDQIKPKVGKNNYKRQRKIDEHKYLAIEQFTISPVDFPIKCSPQYDFEKRGQIVEFNCAPRPRVYLSIRFWVSKVHPSYICSLAATAPPSNPLAVIARDSPASAWHRLNMGAQRHISPDPIGMPGRKTEEKKTHTYGAQASGVEWSVDWWSGGVVEWSRPRL